VFDLTLLSRVGAISTFEEDLAALLSGMADPALIERDFLPDVPNAGQYPVDYCIGGKNDIPLFLYGVPSRDKARLTTIMLSNFLRHNLRFDSLLVFRDQSEIPRADLARLSDVGGEMVSSLASKEDLRRKLQRWIAA